MLFFGNKKGKTIPLSNQEKSKKNEEEQVKKLSVPIELTIDAKGFKFLSTGLEDKYETLARVNESLNDCTSIIDKAKKHMGVELQIMGNQKAQLLYCLIQQAEEIFKEEEEESNYSNEEIEDLYAKTNDQFEMELLSLIEKIYGVSQKEAHNYQKYLFCKQYERQLDDQNGALNKKMSRFKSGITEKQKFIEYLDEVESKLREKSRRLFEKKKRANNLLQQTKGNVRVYCRLRPCDSSAEPLHYEVNQNLIKIKKNKKDLKSNNSLSQWDYLFERVFDIDTTQQTLFNQLSELVQCSFDGKNVCIFAYGQTGSGKTFTMNGSLDNETRHLRGFIPRSIEYIFAQVRIAKTKGYKSKIYISVSQIYKDKQRDLLGINKNENKNENKSKNYPGSSKNTTGGYTQLGQFQYSEVSNPEVAIFLLKETLKARTTANTLMNEQSSRSHLIFEIKYEIEHQERKKKRTSSLVLVDLAGSQRRKDAGESIERQQEGTSINNSLTNLGNVIRAIKDGGMPSFRSNVLTMALQRHLEGDSKVVMFVNVSTEKSNLEQTVNSLNFADQARSCQIKKDKKRHTNLARR